MQWTPDYPYDHAWRKLGYCSQIQPSAPSTDTSYKMTDEEVNNPKFAVEFDLALWDAVRAVNEMKTERWDKGARQKGCGESYADT